MKRLIVVALLWGGVASAQDLRVETRWEMTTPFAGMPIANNVRVWNQGPAAVRAKVENPLPARPELEWSCVAVNGGQCGALQGAASIAETVSLPPNGEVRYRIRYLSDPCGRAPGDARNTVKATALDATDPDLSNNEDSTVVTNLLPRMQLRLQLDDGKTTAVSGETSVYTLKVSNEGPACAKGLTVSAPLVPAFAGATWTCAADGSSTCGAARGSGALRDTPLLQPNEPLTYTITAALSPSFTGPVTYGASAVNQEWGNTSRADATDATQVTAGKPLDCSAARASVAVVWPPDHRMVAVTVSGTPAPAKVTTVKQDEPVDAAADGSTGPDAALLPDGGAQVRAERAGGGDGRVYHLGYQAVAPSGARCQGSVQACVPPAQGRTCGDGGAAFDSTGLGPVLRKLPARPIPPTPPQPPPIKR